MQKRLFFLGFTLWKRGFIKPFFKTQDNELIFLNSLQNLKNFHLKKEDEFFIWGKRISKNQLEDTIKRQIQNSFDFTPQISFVEDGFIRSISLGSDLTRPYSIIIDNKGLYINPNTESELENILQNYDFDENLLKRAQKLIEFLRINKFSKYNGLKHENIKFKAKEKQKIILIPAQVEDDASMILGGCGLSTEEFIKEVRQNNPKAYIVFKPHPDVLSGNRLGLKDEKIILKFCDEMIQDLSIDSAINASDEIHTITSTAGFDALLRHKEVFTYGKPFYAGWGLTKDKHKIERRKKKLSLEELVAGTLILYPKYIHPKTKDLCEIELTLDIMLQMQQEYFSKTWLKMRIDLRNFFLRKIRRIFENIMKKT